jgi:hypothetical protein
MQAPIAATYMGASEAIFLERFAHISIREGTNRFWAKTQLDQIIMSQFDYVASAARDDPLAQEYVAWAARRVLRPRDIFRATN